MATLTTDQVTALAYNAGFRGDVLWKMVAIAWGESSFRTDATSYTGCCHGLWQINDRDAWPQFRANVNDPTTNAKYAFKIYKAQGLKAWSAYGGSNYNSKVKEAQASALKLSANPASQAGILDTIAKGTGLTATSNALPNLPNPLAPAEAAISVANRVGHWITDPDNLMRIFKVLMGAGVIVVGAAIMGDKAILNVASNAIPVGKAAAKVAKAVTK